MPIEIIVALSNFRMVGRGVKKIFGMLKGPYLHPFFYYGYSSFQFVLPFVILPLSNHLMIIIFFTFDNLLNAIWQKKNSSKIYVQSLWHPKNSEYVAFWAFYRWGPGGGKNQGEAKGIISLPFCILLNNWRDRGRECELENERENIQNIYISVSFSPSLFLSPFPFLYLFNN